MLNCVVYLVFLLNWYLQQIVGMYNIPSINSAINFSYRIRHRNNSKYSGLCKRFSSTNLKCWPTKLNKRVDHELQNSFKFELRKIFSSYNTLKCTSMYVSTSFHQPVLSITVKKEKCVKSDIRGGFAKKEFVFSEINLWLFFYIHFI